MDKKKLAEYLRQYADKYKYILIVCLVGVALACLPVGEEKTEDAPLGEQPSLDAEVESLERKLEYILGSISGVGRIEVAVTADTSRQAVYAYDEDRSVTMSDGGQSADTRTTIVSIGSSGDRDALTVRTDQPIYRGAVIVCDGAENASVRLQLAQAASSLIGIGTDRIVISKMKS